MKLTVTVKGLDYRVTSETQKTMAEVLPLKARLEREPSNPSDANAIKVILLDKPWSDFHIGYLSRQVAEEFAPLMDKGLLKISKATITEMDGDGEATIKLVGVKRKSLQKREI